MPTDKDSFTVEAKSSLHKDILAARKAGRRYGGKLYSCTLAFELGAKILLGCEEPEEEAIRQEIEECRVQKAAIDQKEKMRLEQLRMMEASKAAKLSDAAEQNKNVQKLAQRIIDVWDSIVIYKKYTIISSLVEIDKTRLTRPRLEAIFPKNIQQKPSIDEAVKMAVVLLEGEGIGA